MAPRLRLTAPEQQPLRVESEVMRAREAAAQFRAVENEHGVTALERLPPGRSRASVPPPRQHSNRTPASSLADGSAEPSATRSSNSRPPAGPDVDAAASRRANRPRRPFAPEHDHHFDRLEHRGARCVTGSGGRDGSLRQASRRLLRQQRGSRHGLNRPDDTAAPDEQEQQRTACPAP